MVAAFFWLGHSGSRSTSCPANCRAVRATRKASSSID